MECLAETCLTIWSKDEVKTDFSEVFFITVIKAALTDKTVHFWTKQQQTKVKVRE